jgi:hypothetical protein
MKKKISPTIQMYESAAATFGSRPPIPDDDDPGWLGGGFCIIQILLIIEFLKT